MQNILEVKDLTITFDQEKVVNNISFSLKEKENLVILGPNGAGKSVLLRALLGTISFEGSVNWRENVKIGYVPQRFFPDKNLPLSVEEFFKFKKVDEDKIHHSLLSVGLRDISIFKKKIGELSSGQLQRVLIAWGLIDNPGVLLFDEPTAGIDIGGEETIYNLLAKLEKERDLTIILVTHDLNIVYELADSVLCLNKKALCYGSPHETLLPDSLKRLYGGDVKFYKHGH